MRSEITRRSDDMKAGWNRRLKALAKRIPQEPDLAQEIEVRALVATFAPEELEKFLAAARARPSQLFDLPPESHERLQEAYNRISQELTGERKDNQPVALQ
jgi:hypothetical protein